MIVVSDEQGDTNKGEQELEGYDEDVMHNGKSLMRLKIGRYATHPVVEVPSTRADIRLFANDMGTLFPKEVAQFLGCDFIAKLVA